jgi:hypothetical protein
VLRTCGGCARTQVWTDCVRKAEFRMCRRSDRFQIHRVNTHEDLWQFCRRCGRFLFDVGDIIVDLSDTATNLFCPTCMLVRLRVHGNNVREDGGGDRQAWAAWGIGQPEVTSSIVFWEGEFRKSHCGRVHTCPDPL